jgi:hypothetical protein
VTLYRLTFNVDTDADPSQMLDLLTEAAEVLAQDLRDEGERVDFDEGTACVGPVKPAPKAVSIPARDFEEGVPEGGRITFTPYAVGFKVTTYGPGDSVVETEYVYLNPSTGGGSPDCFVYHGVTGNPDADHPQVFINVGAKRPVKEQA